MNEALWFICGIILGALTIAGIWRTEVRMRRAKNQKALLESQAQANERVMLMLDSLPESYIVVNQDLEIVRASSLATAFGLISDGVLRPNLTQIVTEVFATGERHDVEYDAVKTFSRKSSGRRIWVRVSRVDEERVIILFEDQTEKLRLENTRNDFVANVSHELKTPIGAIRLLTETLQEVQDEPELVRKFLSSLDQESRRLSTLVQEIIQLSRIQNGDPLDNPQPVAVDAMIAEVFERMEVEAQSRKIVLSSGGAKGQYIYGDYALLVTALRNLVDNAVRYSRPSSRVTVAVSAESEKVSIAVIDAGAGIAKEAQERVFERFYRGDAARSRETGGSGLGLSIVKHIVKDHGGNIELWSELNKGSTFTMVLPAYDELANGGNELRFQHEELDSFQEVPADSHGVVVSEQNLG